DVCSSDLALRDELRVRLGVLHLENVELHLLAGELLQLAPNSVRLRALTSDHDSRTGGVDVDPHPAPSALDVHLGDTRALQPLGHHPATLDVFADGVRVELVCVPARLPVGRDAEPEPVRVNLLTHYSAPSVLLFCSAAADLAAGAVSFLAALAFGLLFFLGVLGDTASTAMVM